MLCTGDGRKVHSFASAEHINAGHKFNAVRIRGVLCLNEHGPPALVIHSCYAILTRNCLLCDIAEWCQATWCAYSVYRSEMHHKLINVSETKGQFKELSMIWAERNSIMSNGTLVANLNCGAELVSEATERGSLVKFLNIFYWTWWFNAIS